MTHSHFIRCAGFCAAALFISPAAMAAPAVIGGVAYDTVDDGEPFVQAPPPRQTWKAPAPNKPERTAGLMAFMAPDPGEYVPDRIPRPEERVKKLAVSVSLGETTCLAVGVRALRNLEGLDASLDLGGAPVSAELRHMHCWPQRTGWKSRQWTMVPELLLPFSGGKRTVPVRDGVLTEEPFDLGVEKTAAFWITVTAPAEARAGRYKGAMSVSGGGGPALRLPFEVEVLPITLQRPPDKNWLLYADPGRWEKMSGEQVMAELRDFAAHGFNGLVEGPFGRLEISGIHAGGIRFDDAPFRKSVAQCIAAGLPGPHVCQIGGIPEKVRAALGIECDLTKDEWPEELRRGVTEVARVIRDTTKDAGAPWYFYGVDEPTGDNTYAIQEYQCWHDAGVPTYATFFRPDFLDKASAYLTAPCFVSGLVGSGEKAREAREACEKNGTEFWWYGTGCYVNPAPQEGGMLFNRYGAGVFFWKTGAKSQVTWTFCRPHGDVFNDFDGSAQNSAEPKEQATVYPHLLRPNDWGTYQGAIPTVAWEALREGYNDYRYLHTLQCAIAAARAGGDKRMKQKADKAEKHMTELMVGIPFFNPMSRPAKRDKAPSALELQQIRREIAGEILALGG
ncbi:MAG: hypothetical protein H3C30_13615 [Candidatus Hydrogenedentes bacterium]|nr:hypothetical protein [Candidatus Hydrogenedentota bacterium]